MPKIPIPDIPRLPEHQDNATHFNSAPGLNWNVNPDDPGRALQHFGNRVLAMGLKAGDYLKEFAEERQKAEDTDAFQELELLTIQSNNDMNAFMRENPGRYEDFSREYQTRFEALEERRSEIKSRMSTQGKKAADFYIQKDRLNQTETVSRIERQAFVTAKTQNLETRLSQFAKMGQPVADVQRMIDDYTVGEYPILTPEMADAYMAKYLEQADFFRVRDLIDAGDPDVVENLTKKSGDTFTEYTHLSRDQREQLKRYGEQKQVERENEMDDRVLAGLNSGERVYESKEQIKSDLDNKVISAKQYNRYIGWYEADERERKAAEKQLKAEAKQEEKEKHETLVADWLLNVEAMDFSSIPYVNAMEKKKIWEQAQKEVHDSKSLHRILSAINSRASDGLNGSDVFTTPNGKMLKDYLFGQFMNKDKTKFKGLIYDEGWIWDGDNSQEFQSAQFLQLFQLSKQMLSEGKDFFTIKKEIDGQVKNLKAGRIKQILINAADSGLPEE